MCRLHHSVVSGHNLALPFLKSLDRFGLTLAYFSSVYTTAEKLHSKIKIKLCNKEQKPMFT